MPARTTHVLKVPIGVIQKEDGKAVKQYREIGHVVEMTRRDGTGDPWEVIRLPLDVLNPTLAAMVARQLGKTEGEAEVAKFRLDRKKSTGTGDRGAADSDAGMEQEERRW